MSADATLLALVVCFVGAALWILLTEPKVMKMLRKSKVLRVLRKCVGRELSPDVFRGTNRKINPPLPPGWKCDPSRWRWTELERDEEEGFVRLGLVVWTEHEHQRKVKWRPAGEWWQEVVTCPLDEQGQPIDVPADSPGGIVPEDPFMRDALAEVERIAPEGNSST